MSLLIDSEITLKRQLVTQRINYKFKEGDRYICLTNKVAEKKGAEPIEAIIERENNDQTKKQRKETLKS